MKDYKFSKVETENDIRKGEFCYFFFTKFKTKNESKLTKITNEKLLLTKEVQRY